MIIVLTLMAIMAISIIMRNQTKNDYSKSFFTIVVAFGILISTTYLFDRPQESNASAFLTSQENLEVGRLIFLTVSIGIFISAFIHRVFSKTSGPVAVYNYDVLSIKSQYTCILVSALLLIINVLIRSISLLYSRNEYLPSSWDIGLVSNTIAYLSYIAVFSCAVVAIQYKSLLLRLYAWMNIFCWLIFYLSSASRSVILIPISFIFVKNLNSSFQRNKIREFGSLFLTIFLYSFTLNSRKTNTWGFKHILNEIQFNLEFNLSSAFNIISNINSSISIAGATKNLSRFSTNDLLLSINPLPGFLTSWSNQSDALRINLYVPFSAFGEIASLGYPILLFSVFLLFSIFIIQRNWFVMKYGLNGIITKIHLGLIYGTTFLMLQYNLRASMRVVYLSILISVGARLNLFSKIKKD